MPDELSDIEAATARSALGRLTEDEPPLRFTPQDALGAGRSARRRRTVWRVGASALATGLVATGVTVAPSFLTGGTDTGGHVSAADPRTGSPDRTAPTGPHTTPTGPHTTPTGPHSRATLTNPPPSTPAGCTTVALPNGPALDEQYAATVRGLLPPLGGRLEDLTGTQSYAPCEPLRVVGRSVAWRVRQGAAVGYLQVNATLLAPGTYDRASADLCGGATDCQTRRYADGIAAITSGSAGGQQTGQALTVAFGRPDDTFVTVIATSQVPPYADGGRAPASSGLAAPPLTADQAVALARNPALHP